MKWKQAIRRKFKRRGSALVTVMIFVVIFAFVIAAIMADLAQETRQTHRARTVLNSLEGAKSSLNAMSNNILYVAKTRPPSQLGGVIESLNDVVHTLEPVKPEGMKFVKNSSNKNLTYIKDRGPNDFEYREINDSNDPWYGYTTAKLDWEVVSYLVEDASPAEMLGFDGMGVRQRVTVDYVPLYQFAIFYDPELELHPGPTMNVRGRVHSNEDMFLQAVRNLYFHERVTCAGGIFRMKENEAGSEQQGTVHYKVPRDGGGSDWKNMRNAPSPHNGDKWFDHRDEEVWYQGALDRYKERVLDEAHGISSIRLPLPPEAEGDMSRMLARSEADESDDMKRVKFEYLAALIITGDPGDPSTIKMYKQEVDSNLNRTLTEVDSSDVANIVETGVFYDGHQQTIVRTLDIKMNALRFLPDFDWADSSGIVYVSTQPSPETDGWTLRDENKDPVPVRDGNGDIVWDTGWRAPQVTSMGWMSDGNGSLSDAKEHYMPAVRVLDAETLPRNADGGFGFYTDRPVYSAGNINTNNRATAVIGGESITVTSTPLWLAELDLGRNGDDEPWSDGVPDTSADGTKSILDDDNPDFPSGASTSRNANRGYTRNMGNDWRDNDYDWDKGKWWTRPVGNTTTNIIYMMGNTPSIYGEDHERGDTDRDLFSGGAHNVMRYLEDWNRTHTLDGSMIILFESYVAMHKFRCCNSKGYYTPPTRNYNWDESLKSSEPPPGMPVFVDVKSYPMEPVSYEYASENAP